MPLGGMKADTRTLPPPSTSAAAALPASCPRVRTRRGRTEEGGEVGEEGLDKGGYKGKGVNNSK